VKRQRAVKVKRQRAVKVKRQSAVKVKRQSAVIGVQPRRGGMGKPGTAVPGRH